MGPIIDTHIIYHAVGRFSPQQGATSYRQRGAGEGVLFWMVPFSGVHGITQKYDPRYQFWE